MIQASGWSYQRHITRQRGIDLRPLLISPATRDLPAICKVVGRQRYSYLGSCQTSVIMNNERSIRQARKYRSKKQRPCDLCRTRKIQCKLQVDKAECEHCQKLSRQCTFVLQPLKRSYRSATHQIRNDGSQIRVAAEEDNLYTDVNAFYSDINLASSVDNAVPTENDITGHLLESWSPVETQYGR